MLRPFFYLPAANVIPRLENRRKGDSGINRFWAWLRVPVLEPAPRRVPHNWRLKKGHLLCNSLGRKIPMKVATYARVSTDDKGQDPLNQLLELFASPPLGRAGPSYRIYARSNGEERRQNRLQANVGRHGKAPIRSAALLVARPAHPRGHVQDAHISAPPNGCGRQIQELHRAICRLAGRLRGSDHRRTRRPLRRRSGFESRNGRRRGWLAFGRKALDSDASQRS